MPQKNYLIEVCKLTGFVIIGLLLLNIIPDSWTEKLHLRKMDILSDIRPDNNINLPHDSVAISPLPFDTIQIKLDTCKAGMICFDDFTPEQKGLSSLFKTLNQMNTLRRPIRIAFFGDSFIEGDIFCGDLRAKFQENLGGRGVGLMPLTSPVNNFRKTVIHKFGNWNSYSLINYSKNISLGISGNVFFPGQNAWVYYGGVKYKTGLDTCSKISIFYSLSGKDANITYQVNDGIPKQAILTSSEGVERFDISGISCDNIHINFPPRKDLAIYGVSLEDQSGVLIDNFSMRGSIGATLNQIPEKILKGFNQTIHYDLIILQYGLNVMEPQRMYYTTYKNNMIKTINQLKSCFPTSDFLLLSVPDRSMKRNGTYQTMPGVWGMIDAQKKIAAETGIVFWNLFEAMGGENSMVDFVRSSRAAKDYTHLNFQGGEYLGNILYETIMYEKERHGNANKIIPKK